MAKTTKLGMEYTTDETTLFKNWWVTIPANLLIIDAFAGTILDEVDKKQDTLTDAQLSAVNSGITSAKVAEFEAKQSKLTAGTGISISDDGTISVSFASAESETF